jgi:hypothetical protein
MQAELDSAEAWHSDSAYAWLLVYFKAEVVVVGRKS